MLGMEQCTDWRCSTEVHAAFASCIDRNWYFSFLLLNSDCQNRDVSAILLTKDGIVRWFAKHWRCVLLFVSLVFLQFDYVVVRVCRHLCVWPPTQSGKPDTSHAHFLQNGKCMKSRARFTHSAILFMKRETSLIKTTIIQTSALLTKIRRVEFDFATLHATTFVQSEYL